MKKSLLRCKNVEIKHDDAIVVSDVSMNCLEGEIVLLIGINGSGKTSLMNVLSAHTKNTNGEIFFNDENIKGMNIVDKSIFCSYLPQFIEKLDDLIVKDYLEMVKTINAIEVSSLLKLLTPTLLLNKRMGQLSGGELKKISFFAAIKSNPRILFLDEPFQNLDPQTKLLFMNTLTDFAKLGRGVILTSHDFVWATKMATKVYGLHNGEFITGNKDVAFFSKVMKYPFLSHEGTIVPETGERND
jgi:ABC-type multidrug transport system ATPase subunit